METVLFISIGVMASVGLGYLLVLIQRWILRPRTPTGIAAVLPVFANENDVEQRLRSAYTDLLSGAYGGKPLLLIADFGADEETLRICRAFCGETQLASLCAMDELQERLQGLQS